MTAKNIIQKVLEEVRTEAKAGNDGGGLVVESRPKTSAKDIVHDALAENDRWWLSQGREPRNGERIVNSPVESETTPTALAAGKNFEKKQRAACSRPTAG